MKKKRDFWNKNNFEGCGRLYSRVQLAHQIEQSHCVHSNREMKYKRFLGFLVLYSIPARGDFLCARKLHWIIH